nr:G protein-coupled receptor [Proales similis]
MLMLATALFISLSFNALPSNAERIFYNCYLEIQSVGDQYLSQEQQVLINSTKQRCQSKILGFFYNRNNKFRAEGESLSEFNQFIEPLAASISYFGRIEMHIIEARGISSEFKIPDLGRVEFLLIQFMIFELRILNRDGTAQQNCSSLQPIFSPWTRNYPTRVDLNEAIRYHEDTCPTIFANSMIYQLVLNEVIKSTVKHNILAFRPTFETLNASIENLRLSGYGISFNNNTYPSVLFGLTKTVEIDGIVREFEQRILRNSSLTLIILDSLSLRAFFHNNPNWLNDANQRSVKESLMVILRNDKTVGITNDDSYAYHVKPARAIPFDDASFCIFYQIELYSLNVKLGGYLMEREAQKNCTCLLYWLIGNYWALNHSSVQYLSDLGMCVQDEVSLSRLCQFDKMAQRCSIDKIETTSYHTLLDTIFGLEFVKYLADVWLTPVSSVLGVIANFLVIRTFRKIKNSPEYRRNKLTDKGRFMWVYTYYNSWFVLFHSLIFTLMPLTSCIEYNGIYCPRIAVSKFSQAYYLFAQSFFGNTMRLMANMSQTLFVLFRFGLNTDRLSRFRKIRPGKLLACLSVPATLLSLVTLFTNDRFPIDTIFKDYADYILNFYFTQRDAAAGYEVLYLINVFLVTTLFTLFNMLVDLRLLSLLRKQNAQRRKEEVENRITKMVILNGLFSFLFRTPEMVSTIFFFIHMFDQDFFPVCISLWSRNNSVCPMLFDLSRLLLTLSFLENLLLLYLFNPNFKKNFSNQNIDDKK